jgi:hypothetical protein
MHFLVIDNRFQVPVFVFLERDPRDVEADPKLRVREVTLELVSQTDRACGVRAEAAIGADPARRDCFREFATDRTARSAGYAPVEPRYVGLSWETYLSVFRPEGGSKLKRPVRPAGLASAIG